MPKWIKIVGGLKNENLYIPVLDQYGKGWNTCNIDLILDCFSVDVRYRDSDVDRRLVGINKTRRHLNTLFDRFPVQEKKNIEVSAHQATGVFSVWYQFVMSGKKEEMSGEGYEKIIVENGKICLNDVYLRVDEFFMKIPIVGYKMELLAIWKNLQKGLGFKKKSQPYYYKPGIDGSRRPF